MWIDMDMVNLSIIRSTWLPGQSLCVLVMASLCWLSGGQAHAEAGVTPQELGDETMQNRVISPDDTESHIESKLENIPFESRQSQNNQPNDKLEPRATRYGVGYEYRMSRVQRPQRVQRPERPNRPQRPGR